MVRKSGWALLLAVVMAVMFAQGVAAASTVAVSPGGVTTGVAGAPRWTFRNTGKTFDCTTSRFVATLTPGTSTGVTLPFAVASDLQFAFGPPCTMTGGLGFAFSCDPSASLRVTGSTVAGDTPLAITNVVCQLSLTGSTCTVRILGSVRGNYSNGSVSLTVASSGQSLVAVGSSNGRGSTCASLPNDTSVSFTDGSGNSLVFAVTPSSSITVT
jgi:hypothetical protein